MGQLSSEKSKSADKTAATESPPKRVGYLSEEWKTQVRALYKEMVASLKKIGITEAPIQSLLLSAINTNCPPNLSEGKLQGLRLAREFKDLKIGDDEIFIRQGLCAKAAVQSLTIAWSEYTLSQAQELCSALRADLLQIAKVKKDSWLSSADFAKATRWNASRLKEYALSTGKKRTSLGGEFACKESEGTRAASQAAIIPYAIRQLSWNVWSPSDVLEMKLFLQERWRIFKSEGDCLAKVVRSTSDRPVQAILEAGPAWQDAIKALKKKGVLELLEPFGFSLKGEIAPELFSAHKPYMELSPTFLVAISIGALLLHSEKSPRLNSAVNAKREGFVRGLVKPVSLTPCGIASPLEAFCTILFYLKDRDMSLADNQRALSEATSQQLQLSLLRSSTFLGKQLELSQILEKAWLIF